MLARSIERRRPGELLRQERIAGEDRSEPAAAAEGGDEARVVRARRAPRRTTPPHVRAQEGEDAAAERAPGQLVQPVRAAPEPHQAQRDELHPGTVPRRLHRPGVLGPRARVQDHARVERQPELLRDAARQLRRHVAHRRRVEAEARRPAPRQPEELQAAEAPSGERAAVLHRGHSSVRDEPSA